jgi:hypothetical protein
MTLDSKPSGLLRLILPLVVLAAIMAGAFGVFAVMDRLTLDARMVERRALVARNDALTASALRPGVALACLDDLAGEATETACEAAVFVSPQSTAAAVAFTGARLTLLADAHRFDPALLATFAAARRAVALDRFGLAAHVLSVRDGCTPEHCPAFAWLGDAGAVKGNMKAEAFDQYVSRHADAWNAPAVAPPAAVSEAAPSPQPSTQAATLEPKAGEQVARPIPDKYTLPSAASIPAVSIMNSEPALPKSAVDAQAMAPNAAPPKAEAKAEPRAPSEGEVPVPPKRPQVQSEQAAPPPAR